MDIEELLNSPYKVVKELMEGVLASDIPELVAKTYRKSFDALVAEGFTEEQAMELLSRQGLNLKTG